MGLKLLLVYLAIMNVAGLTVMGIDKRKAIKGAWRIPEKTLFLVSILGGSVGTLVGMYLFHHKTKHWYFVIGMPLILIVQVAAGSYLYTHVSDRQLSPEKQKPAKSAVTQETKKEEPKEPAYSFINPKGKTLQERIRTPEGFCRTKAKKGSLTEFIRGYEMKDDGSPVLLYDGREKGNREDHVAVFKLPLENEDLQQCADSVMRMYGEYYYSKGQYAQIRYTLGGGFQADFDTWRKGRGIGVNGNSVYWTSVASHNSSYDSFKKFMRVVFAYSGTMNLEADAKEIKENQITVGDIFIHGGSPGHVVMVVDTCEKDGEKAFLLAQGYMPAQEFHVLRNPEAGENPWYMANEITYPFRTPGYTFQEGSLKRPKLNKE
ncbi:Uncharacterized membrane protein YsdA, DUF1294 family [Lachnospiraceae bacterium XBB1006]|nr:Uncharacterized membrane protein YsdA, DUF1294 family [Lachnospiraceae bacterium XBB1006]